MGSLEMKGVASVGSSWGWLWDFALFLPRIYSPGIRPTN